MLISQLKMLHYRKVIFYFILIFLIISSSIHFGYAGRHHLPDYRAFAIYTRVPPKIDGKVDKVWLRAPQQRGFTQQIPVEGIPASEDTRFYVLYDEHHIYFLFIMLDSDPRSIPARLFERDQDFYPDDCINFYLDTYWDRRKAYFFSTNARGVERDGLISENGDKIDMSWDGIFQVESRITRFGWIAEFSIPLKTLRFDDDKRYQVWGFNVWRVRKKDREISSWAPVSQDFQMYRLDRGGVLIGMKRIQSGINLNLLPYVTARSQNLNDENKKQEFKGGLDLKYGINTDLTLDLTLNPDFGQVEIDEEQINLDKRFEVQLPEKRPFFLENTNLFQTPFYQLFYSRRIGAASDIKGGGKLTGKIGPYSVGLLGVSTGNWGGGSETSTEEFFTVARVQRDIFHSSNLGMMFVDREANFGRENAHFSRAMDMDWALHSGQFYSFGQMVYSVHDNYEKDGMGLFLEGGYYGRIFRFDLNIHSYSPKFDIDSTGYFEKIPDKGRTQVAFYSDMHPYVNYGIIRQWGVSVTPTVFQDSDESMPAMGVQSSIWATTQKESQLRLGFSRYRDVETYFLNQYISSPLEEYVYWGTDLFAEITTDPGRPISLYLKGNYDSQYYFQLHNSGYNIGVETKLRLRPSSNMHLELGYKQTRFLDKEKNQIDKQLIGQSDIRIFTLRGRYLFTKNVFTRLFYQFTNGAEQPYWSMNNNTFQLQYQVWDRMSANLLFGWRYLPGSTLYLVYTEEWDRFPGEKFKSGNRILFFKLSYWWGF